MADFVIDSYAWIEYFKGSAKGQKVVPCVEEGGGITPVIVIAELSAFYERSKIDSWKEDLDYIVSRTQLAELTLEIARVAGRRRQELRQVQSDFGLIDAIIYETALASKATVVTGDPHFKNLPDVLFL